jgi:hypothetical protein
MQKKIKFMPATFRIYNWLTLTRWYNVRTTKDFALPSGIAVEGNDGSKYSSVISDWFFFGSMFWNSRKWREIKKFTGNKHAHNSNYCYCTFSSFTWRDVVEAGGCKTLHSHTKKLAPSRVALAPISIHPPL